MTTVSRSVYHAFFISRWHGRDGSWSAPGSFVTLILETFDSRQVPQARRTMTHFACHSDQSLSFDALNTKVSYLSGTASRH
jgi:hypothetical protein